MRVSAKILSTLRREKKLLENDIGCLLGLRRPLFENARGTRILVYHGICKKDPLRFNSLFVTENTFERHLRFFKKYFQVISIDDFYQGRVSNNRLNIVISFDDGFANNYHYALPLLQRYNMPAVFFVTAIRAAGFDILWNDFLAWQQRYGPRSVTIDSQSYRKNRHSKYVSAATGRPLADALRAVGFEPKAAMMKAMTAYCDIKKNPQEAEYWLQMTAVQIASLASVPGMTVGSHGHYHNDLAQLDAAQCGNELAVSKEWLEKTTGKKIRALAFPYGSYSSDTIALARDAGYDQLLGVALNAHDNGEAGMLRGRFTVNPYISVNNQMMAIVNEKYE